MSQANPGTSSWFLKENSLANRLIDCRSREPARTTNSWCLQGTISAGVDPEVYWFASMVCKSTSQCYAYFPSITNHFKSFLPFWSQCDISILLVKDLKDQWIFVFLNSSRIINSFSMKWSLLETAAARRWASAQAEWRDGEKWMKMDENGWWKWLMNHHLQSFT